MWRGMEQRFAVVFVLELLGGPFDGVEGLRWIDVGDGRALPETILVGRCPGSGACSAACRRAHVSYWMEDEQPPVRTVSYLLVDEDSDKGWARYVASGVDVEVLCAGAVVAAGW